MNGLISRGIYDGDTLVVLTGPPRALSKEESSLGGEVIEHPLSALVIDCLLVACHVPEHCDLSSSTVPVNVVRMNIDA